MFLPFWPEKSHTVILVYSICTEGIIFYDTIFKNNRIACLNSQFCIYQNRIVSFQKFLNLISKIRTFIEILNLLLLRVLMNDEDGGGDDGVPYSFSD